MAKILLGSGFGSPVTARRSRLAALAATGAAEVFSNFQAHSRGGSGKSRSTIFRSHVATPWVHATAARFPLVTTGGQPMTARVPSAIARSHSTADGIHAIAEGVPSTIAGVPAAMAWVPAVILWPPSAIAWGQSVIKRSQSASIHRENCILTAKYPKYAKAGGARLLTSRLARTLAPSKCVRVFRIFRGSTQFPLSSQFLNSNH